MEYKNVEPAVFLRRPNRFIAHVLRQGHETVCHVKNTGRCRELLVPGATVYIQKADNPHRKTAYDLIAVEKNGLLINLDAAAPNRVFAEWAAAGHFLPGLTLCRPETTFGDSRFDFYVEAPGLAGFVEVKGVTLEEDGAVYFPDAPTERGVKHLQGLIRAVKTGYRAWVVFVVQLSPARFFAPNDRTHPAFGAALREARAAGVEVLALSCRVTPQSLTVEATIPVVL